MSFNYNFPAIVTNNTLFRQFKKIQEEAHELEGTWEWKNTEATDEEVMDVIHACETYLRIRERQGANIDDIRQQVENKNRIRGYYENNI